jgi:hypothetical protein
MDVNVLVCMGLVRSSGSRADCHLDYQAHDLELATLDAQIPGAFLIPALEREFNENGKTATKLLSGALETCLLPNEVNPSSTSKLGEAFGSGGQLPSGRDAIHQWRDL